MDSFYFFAILGSAVVILILFFDGQQRKRVKKTLKQTNDVEPLLMMQNMDRKIEKLNRILNTLDAKLERQFHKSAADYKAGRIDMDTYNKHLNELLRRAEATEKDHAH